MGITDFSGALVVHGQQPAVNGMVADYNQNAAPSMFYDGAGLLDPRFGYFSSANLGYRALGFYGSSNIDVIDMVPYTATANNIAASQQAVSGTALTLVSTSGAGVTVLAAATQILPSGVILPAGTLALDSVQSILKFGTAQDIGVYDPATMCSRALVITTAGGSDASGFYTVNGWDVYGYPMTQKVTGPNATTGATLKAFKYIGSIVPSGTISSTSTTVGTLDTIGLPIQATYFGDLQVNYGTTSGTLVTAVTGFVTAVTTSPSTNLLGDVRGTYALQTASNNTLRLQIHQTPRPALLQASAITGLFGVTQA